MKLARGGGVLLEPLHLPARRQHASRSAAPRRPPGHAPAGARRCGALVAVAGTACATRRGRRCAASVWARRAAADTGASGASDSPEAAAIGGRDAGRLRQEILRVAEDGELRGRRLAAGLEVLDAALRLLGPDGLVVAFNGGKDATVVLHLARAAMAGLGPDDRRPLRVMYLPSDDEFPEVDAFVDVTARSFPDIDVSMVLGGLGVGLDRVCSEEARTAAAEIAVTAGHRLGLGFVLGTKINDPNAKGQGTFEPSSPKFPPFWRVNPILDWSYADVWHFLRQHGLPYCSMYDRGYTSIGQQANTAPNPVLRCEDGSYLPAYALEDESLERAGRLRRGAAAPDPLTPDVPLPGDTAGIVVIGNEVLKGLIPDRNSAEAVWRLRTAGVALGRIAVVPDDAGAIAAEVRRQSGEFDFVITSGGVGPTHDDVTMRGVGKAFGMPLAFPDADARFAELLRGSHGSGGSAPLTQGQRHGAKLPVGHALRWLEGRDWPVVQVRNVFVLPGVPKHFVANLRAILGALVRCPGGRPPTQRLRLSLQESTYAGFLRKLACSMPYVSFGSYPTAEGTTITVESRSEAAVGSAVQRLLEELPAEAVLSVDAEDALLPPAVRGATNSTAPPEMAAEAA